MEPAPVERWGGIDLECRKVLHLAQPAVDQFLELRAWCKKTQLGDPSEVEGDPQFRAAGDLRKRRCAPFVSRTLVEAQYRFKVAHIGGDPERVPVDYGCHPV